MDILDPVDRRRAQNRMAQRRFRSKAPLPPLGMSVVRSPANQTFFPRVKNAASEGSVKALLSRRKLPPF